MIKGIQNLQEAIKEQLSIHNLEVTGIQPVPTHSDKLVRLNTLEEILQEFEDSSSPESISYILQVKPNFNHLHPIKDNRPPLLQPLPVEEPLYLPDGSLNSPYLMNNAELLKNAGDYSLAKSIYLKILDSGYEAGTVLGKLAHCLEAEGNLKEACSRYEEAITYSPSLENYQHLAAILTRQGNDGEAAIVLERALNLKELDNHMKFQIHKSCGNSLVRANQFEKAEKHFTQALEISPSSGEIKSNLGNLYLQAEKLEKAKKCFRDAVASDANNYLALTGLGCCILAEGDKVTAHDYFSRALKIELNNPTAIFYLVKCAFEIKSYAKACQILEDYIQIVPVNSNLLYSLAGLRFHLGRFSEAKETVLKILELQPQHPGAKELLTLVERYAGA